VLAQVLGREEAIDVLKIDTEGGEEQAVAAIAPAHLRRIRAIYFEAPGVVRKIIPGLCPPASA